MFFRFFFFYVYENNTLSEFSAYRIFFPQIYFSGKISTFPTRIVRFYYFIIGPKQKKNCKCAYISPHTVRCGRTIGRYLLKNLSPINRYFSSTAESGRRERIYKEENVYENVKIDKIRSRSGKVKIYDYLTRRLNKCVYLYFIFF